MTLVHGAIELGVGLRHGTALEADTSKNAFQNVCRSARSLDSPAQSLENLTALWRISFQEMGMDGNGTGAGRVEQCWW
jgi:hypothetical protein